VRAAGHRPGPGGRAAGGAEAQLGADGQRPDHRAPPGRGARLTRQPDAEGRVTAEAPDRSPGRVVVVGLGPGGSDLLLPAARAALLATAPERRFVRTLRHPAVDDL